MVKKKIIKIESIEDFPKEILLELQPEVNDFIQKQIEYFKKEKADPNKYLSDDYYDINIENYESYLKQNLDLDILYEYFKVIGGIDDEKKEYDYLVAFYDWIDFEKVSIRLIESRYIKDYTICDPEFSRFEIKY